MKRFAKIAILLCICVFALIGVAACSSVTGISIDKKNNTSLQTVFVQGQELDLSGGVLTVTTDDGTELISLSSDDVTVTGYDSSKLGKQTLTIEYGGKSTTLTITVVQRIATAGIDVEYFIGEDFNVSVGTLQIYRNDGTSFTANMSDDTVSVSGFDSSKVGSCEVTLTYKSDTEEYSDTVTVTIYSVADITIHKPNKISYKSHETELDLTGGYITVKNESGSYIDYINLTEDMVSGFDLSEATYENSRNTEYKQTITITYGNKSKTFTISITYSDVSVIQDCAEQFSALDWSSSIPELDNEQGQLAIDALSLFDGLSADDKSYIDDDVYLAVARVAAAYGLSQLETALNANKAVLLYENGEFQFISCGYEDTQTDYANLSSEEISDIAEKLVYVINNYGNEYVYGTVTFSTYLSMVPSFVSNVSLLGYIIDLYNAFVYTSYGYVEVSEGKGSYVYDENSDEYTYVGSGKGNYDINDEGVPKDWSLDSSDERYLENYLETITVVYSDITHSEYFDSSYRSAYNLLAYWRSDYFTILYAFWALQDSASAVANLSVIYITYPFDEIEELTTYLYTYYYYIGTYRDTSTAYETSLFMYYYDQYLEYIDIAANKTDIISTVLYVALPIKVVISDDGDYVSKSIDEWLEYFTFSSFGYYGVTYFYTGVQAVDDVWDAYFEVWADYLDAYAEDGDEFDMENFVSGETGTKIAAMFEKFVDLTPTEQYSFLRSVNLNYRNDNPKFVLNFTGSSVYSLFSYAVYYYYKVNLNNDDYFELFCDLLIALEYYDRQNDFSSDTIGMTNFIYYMEKAVKIYDKLDDIMDEEGNIIIDVPGVDGFNKYLDFLYTKCIGIYNLYDTSGNYTGSTDLGEWADTFDELATCISEVYIAYANYSYKDYYHMALIAAFDQAETIAEQILNGASEEVLNVYYYKPMTVVIGTSEYSWTLDYALSYARSLYGAYVSYMSIDGESIYSIYQSSGLHSFTLKANGIFRIYLDYDSATYGDYDTQTVLSLMSDFRSLTAEQRYTFLMLDTATVADIENLYYPNSLYYLALNDFFKGVLSTEAATAAYWLMRAEFNYVAYEYDPYGDGTNVDGQKTSVVFSNNMYYAIQYYEELSATDKAAFDELLGDVYVMYLAVYNTLNTDANA